MQKQPMKETSLGPLCRVSRLNRLTQLAQARLKLRALPVTGTSVCNNTSLHSEVFEVD